MHGGERAFSQQKVRHKKRAKTTKCTQSLVACMAGAKKGGGGGRGEGRKARSLPVSTAATQAMQTVESRAVYLLWLKGVPNARD